MCCIFGVRALSAGGRTSEGGSTCGGGARKRGQNDARDHRVRVARAVRERCAHEDAQSVRPQRDGARVLRRQRERRARRRRTRRAQREESTRTERRTNT